MSDRWSYVTFAAKQDASDQNRTRAAMGVAVERESSILPLSVGLVLVLREASERGEQYISCSASCEQQREAGAEARDRSRAS